jgi:hypothetical protein
VKAKLNAGSIAGREGFVKVAFISLQSDGGRFFHRHTSSRSNHFCLR